MSGSSHDEDRCGVESPAHAEIESTENAQGALRVDLARPFGIEALQAFVLRGTPCFHSG